MTGSNILMMTLLSKLRVQLLLLSRPKRCSPRRSPAPNPTPSLLGVSRRETCRCTRMFVSLVVDLDGLGLRRRVGDETRGRRGYELALDDGAVGEPPRALHIVDESAKTFGDVEGSRSTYLSPSHPPSQRRLILASHPRRERFLIGLTEEVLCSIEASIVE